MRLRVLIFDDEKMIRNLLKIALSERNYEIFDFENPSICPIYKNPECNCPLNEMCADIIITDIRMPYINGLEFIKKQKEKGCKVKSIVIISAFASYESIKEATDLGCIFLRKPFKIDELLTILDKFEQNIDPDRMLSDWET